MAFAAAWPRLAAARCWLDAGPMAARNSLPGIPIILSQLTMVHLARRAEFLAAAREISRVAGTFPLELTPTPEGQRRYGEARIGFTASRKIGNAVARNRAKRR